MFFRKIKYYINDKKVNELPRYCQKIYIDENKLIKSIGFDKVKVIYKNGETKLYYASLKDGFDYHDLTFPKNETVLNVVLKRL